LNSAAKLRTDALAIWRAAVAAAQSDRLVRECLRIEGDRLTIGDDKWSLASIHRIVVVGAGKAGAGMAAGVEQSLGPKLLAEKQIAGWVNVPADCVQTFAEPDTSHTNPKRQQGSIGPDAAPRSRFGLVSEQTSHIHLHAARPAGVNEPTEAGVAGAEKILELVGSLGPSDLCLCLISGGGSALLPAPVPGVSLADKQALTRHLSAAGANIQELNTVRKQLSRIKGGGLARACRAGRLVSLVISDVLGDPLDVIASGPTVPNTTTAIDALAIVERYGGAPVSVIDYLKDSASRSITPTTGRGFGDNATTGRGYVRNLVIGNNALAVDAAGQEAVRRGYSPAMTAATTLEGPAEEIGVHLAQMLQQMSEHPQPDCLITGGEPTVRLVPAEIRGKGGRNQQLVLAALCHLIADFGSQIAESSDTLQSAFRIPQSAFRIPQSAFRIPQFCLLSGGTDGEDGPTDAAGAIIDNDLLAQLAASGLDPRDYLRRNDAYSFFDKLDGLIKTGPTHTNVCDVRVLVVGERGA
jgi:hydroxypyruvate reductase